MLLIGYDNRGNGVFQSASEDISDNLHRMYLGGSGCGKSSTMQLHMNDAFHQGISSVIIDTSGSYTAPNIHLAFADVLGENLVRRIVYQEGLGIDPLKRHKNSLKVIEKDSDVADRFSDIVAKTLGMGYSQRARLYGASMKYYDEGMVPLNSENEYFAKLSYSYGKVKKDFHLLQYCLAEYYDDISRSVLDKTASLIDKDIFTGKAVDWNQILYCEPTVTIFDLSGFSDHIQRLIMEFLLWDFWFYTMSFGAKEKPFIAVFDECQNLNQKKNSPIAKILTEGRKFGWSCWLGTQFLGEQFEPDEIRRLQQAALQLYFRPASSDIKSISKAVGNDIHQNECILESLRQRECLVKGTYLTEAGNIVKNTVIKILIPLMNRESLK